MGIRYFILPYAILKDLFIFLESPSYRKRGTEKQRERAPGIRHSKLL